MKKTGLIVLSGFTVTALSIILGISVYAQAQGGKQNLQEGTQNTKTVERACVNKNCDGTCDSKTTCSKGKEVRTCDGKACSDCTKFKDTDGNGICNKLNTCDKHGKKTDSLQCQASCHKNRSCKTDIKKPKDSTGCCGCSGQEKTGGCH